MRSLRSKYKYLLHTVSTACLLAVVACSGQSTWKNVALPEFDKARPVALKVAYVNNPRFASLEAAQQTAILQRTRQLVKKHFDIDVVFGAVDSIGIEPFFDNLLPEVKQQRQAEIVDLRTVDEKSRVRMHDSVHTTLKNYSNDHERVINFARPYLTDELTENDFPGLADALVATLLQRLEYWYQHTADDGKPVLDGSPYNEWVWWDSLGYGDVPYDVVITNQLIASAEYYGMDVHSSLRGGITAGTTTYPRRSAARPLQGFSTTASIRSGLP